MTASGGIAQGGRSGQAPVKARQNPLLTVLDHLEEWIITFLIAAATVIIFIAVVHRYSAGISIDIAKWLTAHGMPGAGAVFQGIFTWLAEKDLSWAQELCIY